MGRLLRIHAFTLRLLFCVTSDGKTMLRMRGPGMESVTVKLFSVLLLLPALSDARIVNDCIPFWNVWKKVEKIVEVFMRV